VKTERQITAEIEPVPTSSISAASAVRRRAVSECCNWNQCIPFQRRPTLTHVLHKSSLTRSAATTDPNYSWTCQLVLLLWLCSCYYTSRVCKYFIDGECYENYTTTTNNASTCGTVFGGYFLKGLCYYHVPRNCSAGQYLYQCTCYPHRSLVYTNVTCNNIGGVYADNTYCYYVDFNCSGYAVNDQCYTRVISI